LTVLTGPEAFTGDVMEDGTARPVAGVERKSARLGGKRRVVAGRGVTAACVAELVVADKVTLRTKID
jgi:hypothetical protein